MKTSMRQKTIYFALFALTLLTAACHQDNDDYMTLATLRLDGGDTLTIERVLLRGAYQVHIEGLLSYYGQDGARRVRSFRAVSDYVELVGSGTSEADLNIIFLD